MLGWLKRKLTTSGHFARLDAGRFPAFAPGSVWLVGAGPGAPGLITLLGYHALGAADVIVYDALVNPGVLDMANPKAEKIYAGKRGGKPSPKQADITLKLVEHARAGKRVLRLKGGDPMMFGRGGEEVQTLVRENIAFRIVPGITAGIGGLAYAGIPVTHRDTNHTVIFLTGHDEKGGIPQGVDWAAIATASPVIVMYMAVKHLPSIAEKLIAAGRDPADRVAIVSNAALPDQSVRELRLDGAGDLADASIPTPAIIVLGPVSRYRESFEWYAATLRENSFG
ncbi:uroporphyrinogen-III C-methyltransferase [Pelagibacterium sp.]|uniref:uroporphyrinogen-III C-methyltransferase n=1 Tax=Pelagibacterium sp. TaxID=1967288 RepID=UPI003A9064F6